MATRFRSLACVPARQARAVDVGAGLDEHADDGFATGRRGGMDRQDAVEDRVDGLTVREGVLDQACVGGHQNFVFGDAHSHVRRF